MAFTDNEIAIIKGMLTRGDTQSHIAAYFGNANGGRISEINREDDLNSLGRRAKGIKAAAPADLPPPGPYFASGRANLLAKDTLRALRDLIDGALTDIESFESTARGEGG